MADINRITLMMRVDDTARADIALTPDRSYYRLPPTRQSRTANSAP